MIWACAALDMNSSSSPRCTAGRTKIVDFAQVFFRVGAVIGDGGMDTVAHGRQKRHRAAETIALDGDLAFAVRKLGRSVQRVLDVADAGVTIIGLIKAKAVLPVRLRVDAKVNARLLSPEQIRRDRDKALLGQFVAGLADVGVHPEDLVQNDDCGCRQGSRPRDVGAKAPSRPSMAMRSSIVLFLDEQRVILRRHASQICL